MTKISRLSLLISLLTLFVGQVAAQQSINLLGSACTPALDQPVTETGTDRTYVLDYPCDLQAGEPAGTFTGLNSSTYSK